MSNNCSLIVFSNKAYNAIIRESFDKDPVETGGILLGHVLNNGVWIVMEVLPPGIDCIFERAYFEYDDAFVNYLAQSVANQYKTPLELLGLWHRHPGSMDFFSSTDDQTNATFASQTGAGVISGLVNIDPSFRLTMYHLDNPRMMGNGHRIQYDRVEIEVGDDIIPEEYFELRYYDGDGSNLHPTVQRNTRTGRTANIHSQYKESVEKRPQFGREESFPHIQNRQDKIDFDDHNDKPSLGQRIDSLIYYFKRHTYLLIIITILLILFGFSIKYAWQYVKPFPKQAVEWLKSKKKPIEKEDSTRFVKLEFSTSSIDLTVGEDYELTLKTDIPVRWKSADTCIAYVNKGLVTAKKSGKTAIYAISEQSQEPAICNVLVRDTTPITEKEEQQATLEITNGKYPDSCQLSIGQVHKLGINATNIEESKVVWESNNPDVVSVSEKGELRGVKKGTVIVFVKHESLSDSIKVTVK